MIGGGQGFIVWDAHKGFNQEHGMLISTSRLEDVNNNDKRGLRFLATIWASSDNLCI